MGYLTHSKLEKAYNKHERIAQELYNDIKDNLTLLNHYYNSCTRYHSMILSTILRQKVYNLFYSKKTKNTIDDYRIFKKADNIEDINFETRLKKSDFKKARLKKINEIKEKSNGQFTEFEQWLYNNI